MAEGTISLPDLAWEVKDVTWPANASSISNVTAPNKEGYRFVCWVFFVTIGFVAYVYPNLPQSQTTNVFLGAGTSPGTDKSIRGLALYFRP